MQNVNVYKINSGVTRQRRYEMVPEHQLTRLTGEQAEAMIEQLVKPIKFRYLLRLSIIRAVNTPGRNYRGFLGFWRNPHKFQKVNTAGQTVKLELIVQNIVFSGF